MEVRTTVDVDGDTPLLWVLRDVLGMTGTKFGCGMALCGACTVHVDGSRHALLHHHRSTASATSKVTTIEAIGATPAGAKIQKAWLDHEVPQCGYCQSGQIMSASALLASNPHPTDADIDDAMTGNICRCGTYVRIREAIKHAAQSNGREADHDPRSHRFPRIRHAISRGAVSWSASAAAGGGLMLSLSLPLGHAARPPAPRLSRRTPSSASAATARSSSPCPMSRWARAPTPRSRC